MKEKFNLKCLFCGSTNFKLAHEGEFPKEGEMVECAECGRENDVSSLINLAKQEAIDKAKEELSQKLKNIFKRSR